MSAAYRRGIGWFASPVAVPRTYIILALLLAADVIARWFA